MRRTRFGPPTLIVSDVDGTLIDDDNTVRPLTREAIRRAAKVGTTFVLATGRPPRWIAEIADQLDTLTYAVCANGAIVFDGPPEALEPGHLRLIYGGEDWL